MHGRAWTNTEKEVIRTEYRGNFTSAKLISQKVHRSISSVKGQIYKLGLGRRIDYRLWTQEEEEKLADLITRLPMHKITKIMGRSVNSIAIHANKLKMSSRARDAFYSTSYKVGHLNGIKDGSKAQLAKSKRLRLDRPELRKEMAHIIKENEGLMELQHENLTVPQLLALIPDEEEIRKQLDALGEEIATLNKKLDNREADLIEAKREERERIVSIIDEWYDLSEKEWEAKYGRDSTKFLDFLRQALKEGE